MAPDRIVANDALGYVEPDQADDNDEKISNESERGAGDHQDVEQPDNAGTP